MNERFIRVYKKIDLAQIKPNLLIYGDVSGQCAACQKLNIKIDLSHCPECKAEFKNISFRNISTHMPKINKLAAERPGVVILDHDDYKKQTGVLKAEEFLK